MKKFKNTAYSQEEKRYMLENAPKTSVEAIAKEMGREAKAVAKWIKSNGLTPVWADKDNAGLGVFSEKLAIKEELRSSHMWKRLKQKFTEDEVLIFEEGYVAVVAQFKDDIFATEENQIHKLLTYQILMDRNLIQRKKILKDIDLMEREQKEIVQSVAGQLSGLDESGKARLESIQSNILLYRDQDRSMTKEYTELEGNHQAIMKDLKGTRDKRITKIEGSKTSFIGLLKTLQEEEARSHEGLNAALMDAATDKEFKRLAKPHKYIDGNEDQPILSADTIDFLEELHKKEGVSP